MIGTKLGLVGVCLGLTDIAVATNNADAIAMAFIGFILSGVGIFLKD